jgi:nicotinamidase-related amidase
MNNENNDVNNKTNDTMEVLVIIDVQNCFMFHQDKVAGDLNVENKADSNKIVQELETLVADKTHVVFSRDFHPVNHISLEGYEGRTANYESIWPKHCRNKNRKCNARNGDNKGDDKGEEEGIKNNFVKIDDGTIIKYKTNPGDKQPNPEWSDINTKISTDLSSTYLEVIGTELSYMFFKSPIFRKPVRQLIINNREGKNKIGLTDTMYEKKIDDPIIKNDAINYGESFIPNNGKPINYISLTKGERCDKEAYSAFNYHIQYTYTDQAKPKKEDIAPNDPANPNKEDIPPNDSANSTGLWEWILKNKTSNKITITVCGLVGNVCVMHSLLQGIALWNNVYSKEDIAKEVEVKFVYSLRGTRFAPVKPFEGNVDPDFISDEVVKHFNNNLPAGMTNINITDIAEPNVIHRNIIESFEVLDYLGKPIKKKITFTFGQPPSKGGGGMRRRRRSVRRRGNKSRKLQKRQKGRRTYKNKPRRTKRR